MNIQQIVDYATKHDVKSCQLLILVNTDYLNEFMKSGNPEQTQYMDLNLMRFAGVRVVTVNFIQGFQIYRE